MLDCFKPGEPRLGLAELVGRLGWRKTTVHRILNSLVEAGMLSKDPATRQYALGYKVLRLAQAVTFHRDLAALTLPVMQALRDQSGETVTLSMAAETDRVVIQQVESEKEIRYVEKVGVGTPLYCGASGKLLLAHLSTEQVSAIIDRPLQRFTRVTITDPQRLRQELASIRLRGYAVSYGEFSAGACAIAAPIATPDGQVVACMAVLGPRDRIPDSRLRQLRPLLLDAVRRVNASFAQPPSIPGPAGGRLAVLRGVR